MATPGLKSWMLNAELTPDAMWRSVQARYTFHAIQVRAFWVRRHEVRLQSGGWTHGRCFRWNLKKMREYRERMRKGEP